MSDEQTKQVDGRAFGILETIGRAWAVRPELMVWLCDLHGSRTWLNDNVVEKLASVGVKSAAKVNAGPNGVAVIPLVGMITPQGSMMEQLFGIGGGGLEGFRDSLRQAVADPDVGSIVLNIDSPGGLVDQVPETASLIRAARSVKPIVAVANTLAASAAYWLAAQAHEVVVSPSGSVGSVGVYQMHQDVTKALENEGVKPTIISAGRYKAEGNPFEPLTGEAFGAMQSDVTDFYKMFVNDVAQGRGITPDPEQVQAGEAFGGGRVLLARRARTSNLADRIGTLDETVSRLASGRARVQRQENAAEGRSSDVCVWDDPEWGRVAAVAELPPVPKPTRPMTDEEKDRLLDALAVQR